MRYVTTQIIYAAQDAQYGTDEYYELLHNPGNKARIILWAPEIFFSEPTTYLRTAEDGLEQICKSGRAKACHNVLTDFGPAYRKFFLTMDTCRQLLLKQSN